MAPPFSKLSCVGAPLFTTTSDADVELRALETDLDNLDRAVVDWYRSTEHTAAIDQFAAGWDKFRKEVRAFLKDVRAIGVPKLAWNVYDNARDYQAKLRQWSESFSKISGGKAPVTPRTSETRAPAEGSSWWKYAAILGAGAVAYGVITSGGRE